MKFLLLYAYRTWLLFRINLDNAKVRLLVQSIGSLAVVESITSYSDLLWCNWETAQPSQLCSELKNERYSFLRMKKAETEKMKNTKMV